MIIIRKVFGNSMLPTLKQGSIVIAIKYRNLKPGNVVILKHNNIEKIKRIEKISEELFWLKGDNVQESTDSRHFGGLSRDNLVGKVIWPRI